MLSNERLGTLFRSATLGNQSQSSNRDKILPIVYFLLSSACQVLGREAYVAGTLDT